MSVKRHLSDCTSASVDDPLALLGPSSSSSAGAPVTIPTKRKRVASVLVTLDNDSSSNSTNGSLSSDYDPDYKKTRRFMKKKWQIPAHCEMKASTITRDEIGKYLNVEYECPSNALHYKHELQGSTEEEILQNLIDDMSTKDLRFPSKTYSTLLNATDILIPTNHRKNVKSFVIDPMTELLRAIDFTDTSGKEMVDSYRHLLQCVNNMLSNLRMPDASAILRNRDRWLEPLQQFLQSSLNQESIAHLYLTKFFENIVMSLCITDEELGVSHKVSVGGTGKDLPVALDLISDEEDEKKLILVGTKPDLLYEKVIYLKDEETCSSEACLNRIKLRTFRAFCMEFKTTSAGFDVVSSSQGSTLESDASSSNESDKSDSAVLSGQSRSPTAMLPKRRSCSSSDRNKRSASCDDDFKPGKISVAPIFDKLKTQHLMELLAMIKSTDKTGLVSSQIHSFGFFVVMHRVYVTGLQVMGPRHMNDHELRKRFVYGILDWSKQKKMRYQMVCCRYFNLFKPEHFKAMMEFIFYLVFKQDMDSDGYLF